MRAPTLRRFLCVLALPCSLALVVACDDDDDDRTNVPATAGAAGTSAGNAGTTGSVIGVGNGGSGGQGGEFTGNGGPNDGDPNPPDDLGGPDLPGDGAGGAIQAGGMGGSSLPITMLGGLLFDLDGTLVDTNDQHARAWGEAFRSCGYRVGHERLLRAMGVGGDNLVAEVLGDDAEARDGQALREADEAVYQAIIEKEGVRQTPGAGALLRALADRGLPLALATSSAEKSTRRVLRLAGLDPAAFRVIVGGDTVASSKPSPDVLVEACRRLGFAPCAVGLVGDTVADTRAARDAGIAVLGIAAGGHGAELRREGARHVYPDPSGLLAELDDALRRLSPGPRVLGWDALDALLDAAFGLAEQGLARGGVPIGCVLAEADGTIVAAAHNESSFGVDPVAHAEIVAFRRAGIAPADAHDRLLASTLEPCVMCAGASMEIGIDTVVYGLRANEDGGVQRVRPPRSPENQTPRFVGPRHEARARALFETFLTQSGDHPSAPFVRSLLEASRGGPRA